MPPRIFGFKAEDAAAILNFLRRYQRAAVEVERIRTEPAAIFTTPQHVRITSTTQVVVGGLSYYDGFRVERDTETGAWADRDQVYVIEINGADLTTGTRYEGLVKAFINGRVVYGVGCCSPAGGDPTTQWKSPVRAASVANVNISSAPSTLDGVTLAANDRVLLKDQTTAAENGIYIFAAAASALTRAADADVSAEVKSGMTVAVAEGTANAATVWSISTADPITLGSTSLKFMPQAPAYDSVKPPVRAASTANVNVSSAPSTLDGVSLSAGDRVLLKDQTTAAENGIYVFSAAASALTRATDADTSSKVKSGMMVAITEGTVNAGRGYTITTANPITLGSTSLALAQAFGSAAAGIALCGSGVDGSVTFDGSTTILGMAPASNVYTMTRDIYCTSITINSGVTLKPAGFRIHANVKVTNGGTVSAIGGNASGATAGTAGLATAGGSHNSGASGTAGNAGGNGTAAVGANGNPQAGQANAAGGYGSAAGAGGTPTGGAAGIAQTAPTAATGSIHNVNQAIAPGPLYQASQWRLAGGGGGGGGATGGGTGGGGGGGGGDVFIASAIIDNSNGTITAAGGNGANGVGPGNAGGGGAGSGGVIVLLYRTLIRGTISVLKGNVGTGVGTGTSGGTGNDGLTIEFVI